MSTPCLTFSDRVRWLLAVNMSVNSIHAVRVAAILFQHCNAKTGQCNPGRSRVAELLGVHVNRVSEGFKYLNEAGFIRQGDSQGRTRQWELFNPCDENGIRCPRVTELGDSESRNQVPKHLRENLTIEHPPLAPPSGGGGERDSSLNGSTRKNRRNRRGRSSTSEELGERAEALIIENERLAQELDGEREGDQPDGQD